MCDVIDPNEFSGYAVIASQAGVEVKCVTEMVDTSYEKEVHCRYTDSHGLRRFILTRDVKSIKITREVLDGLGFRCVWDTQGSGCVMQYMRYSVCDEDDLATYLSITIEIHSLGAQIIHIKNGDTSEYQGRMDTLHKLQMICRAMGISDVDNMYKKMINVHGQEKIQEVDR